MNSAVLSPMIMGNFLPLAAKAYAAPNASPPP